MRTLVTILTIFSSTLSLACAGEIAVDNFRDASVYVTGKNANVQIAAQDLVDYMKRMTGVELKIVSVAGAAAIPADRWAFALDSLAVAKGLGVPTTQYRVDGMAYDVSGKLVRLAGETPQATAFAVADFLERQGVRWYTPGPLGEVVPKRRTLNLPDAAVAQTPSMLSRRPWYDGGGPGANEEDWKQFNDWARRNKAVGGVVVGNGHMWDNVLSDSGGRQKLFSAHPDWFGEVEGRRRARPVVHDQPAGRATLCRLLQEATQRATEGHGTDLFHLPRRRDDLLHLRQLQEADHSARPHHSKRARYVGPGDAFL